MIHNAYEKDRLVHFWEYLAEKHPRSLETVKKSRDIDPVRFDAIAARFISWLIDARGDVQWLHSAIDAYVTFSTDVLFAQAKYERTGQYEHQSFKECEDALYSRRDRMDDYLWGVFITNFAWPHHFELSLFYEKRFLSKLNNKHKTVELAPGHGGWGLWMLDVLPEMHLTGVDISPSSIAIARSLSKAAGLDDRCEYLQADVLSHCIGESSADACICNFLIEHLEEPERLIQKVYELLKPGGIAFISGAITAAQEDHIYEFKSESEIVRMVELENMTVSEMLSMPAPKLLPNAQYVPRSISMIVNKGNG